MLLAIALFYLIVGFYVSGLLLLRASQDEDFDNLSGVEVGTGFFLHVLVWPITVYYIIAE